MNCLLPNAYPFTDNCLLSLQTAFWGGEGRKPTIGTVIAQFLSLVFDSHCLKPKLKNKNGQLIISPSNLYMTLTYLWSSLESHSHLQWDLEVVRLADWNLVSCSKLEKDLMDCCSFICLFIKLKGLNFIKGLNWVLSILKMSESWKY